MSAPSEEVLLMKEEEAKKVKPQMCVISKSGLTLFGIHVSWVILVLVAVLVYFYLNKQGMLGESVSEVVSAPSAPASEAVATMTGGFKRFSVGNPGQVRKMMGH
jgi:hypothetical protein